MSEKVPSSEITPREVYFDRRTVLRGGILAASVGATAYAYRKLNGVDLVDSSGKRLDGLVKGVVTCPEMPTPKRAITNYNNFYEFTTDKDGVADAAAGFKTDRLDRSRSAGSCDKPRVVRPRRSAADQPARGARLPHALRRGVVDGRFRGPASRCRSCSSAVEPTADAKYVAFETLLDPDADAGPEHRRARLAVRRGPADGRGDAPADDPRDRSLRRRSCRRRTARRCGSWCRGSTASRASSRSSRSRWSTTQPPTTWNIARAGRVRLLREREPEARSPALEPGDRAAHRRVGAPQDADVQRLRRSGREPLHGHGPRCPLLGCSRFSIIDRVREAARHRQRAGAGGAARVGRVARQLGVNERQLRHPHDRPDRPRADRAVAASSRRCAR